MRRPQSSAVSVPSTSWHLGVVPSVPLGLGPSAYDAMLLPGWGLGLLVLPPDGAGPGKSGLADTGAGSAVGRSVAALAAVPPWPTGSGTRCGDPGGVRRTRLARLWSVARVDDPALSDGHHSLGGSRSGDGEVVRQARHRFPWMLPGCRQPLLVRLPAVEVNGAPGSDASLLSIPSTRTVPARYRTGTGHVRGPTVVRRFSAQRMARPACGERAVPSSARRLVKRQPSYTRRYAPARVTQ